MWKDEESKESRQHITTTPKHVFRAIFFFLLHVGGDARTPHSDKQSKELCAFIFYHPDTLTPALRPLRAAVL